MSPCLHPQDCDINNGASELLHCRGPSRLPSLPHNIYRHTPCCFILWDVKTMINIWLSIGELWKRASLNGLFCFREQWQYRKYQTAVVWPVLTRDWWQSGEIVGELCMFFMLYLQCGSTTHIRNHLIPLAVEWGLSVSALPPGNHSLYLSLFIFPLSLSLSNSLLQLPPMKASNCRPL